MSLEVSDDIVRELQQTIRTVNSVPERLEPIDPWAQLARRLPTQQQESFRANRGTRGIVSLIPWILGASAVIAGLLYMTQYGTGVKGKVIQQGNAAIGHLIHAKDSLEQMDLAQAQVSLEQASVEFKKAADLIPNIPGIGLLQTSKKLLRAGGLLSDAGTAIGRALGGISGEGGVLNTNLATMQDAMRAARQNVLEAAGIIESVDANDLPETYRAQFTQLHDRLPDITALVDRGNAAIEFLSRMMGTDQPRRYLVLFTNSSELRPTGGFPGSYGLLTFENGKVKEFHADDIYNPDGQLKELVVPPLQLQHITPSWGMRDAAWWIDYPTSADKVMEYWQKSGGASVDGVFSIKPDILAGILNILGPITLPKYNLTLTSDNVIEQLQLEVESKTNAAQPKQIIVDLAPQIFQQLALAPATQWASLLTLFKNGLDTRDIVLHFTDPQLEQFVASESWDGAIKKTDGDYLMVTVSNIKGAKTDAVTDTAVKLESWLQNGTMAHRLTLTRTHNGGSTAYGFYNKPNYSWVRVLVPEGSVLRGISGNAQPSYKPILDYQREHGAVYDKDLQALEGTYRATANGSITYTESGKTGFGFWMTLQPGETKSVQLEYEVPAKYAASDYHLYVQRQPGLDVKDFEFTLQKQGVSGIVSSEPVLKEWPDSWRLHDKLTRDLDLSIQLK